MAQGPRIVLAIVLLMLTTSCSAGTPNDAEQANSPGVGALGGDDMGEPSNGGNPTSDEQSGFEDPPAGEPTSPEPTAPERPTEPEAEAEEPPPSPATPSPTGDASGPSDFPITARVQPECVVPGERIQLTVETGMAETAVVYLAHYAQGENGAPPPYGDGHGGNDGDFTDENGRYEDAWTVSLEAPIGPAWVDVRASRSGMRSNTTVPFTVADPADGGCSQ